MAPNGIHDVHLLLLFPKFCIVEEVQSTLCCKPIDTTPDERSLWHTLIILGQVLCRGSPEYPMFEAHRFGTAWDLLHLLVILGSNFV
jgi:hypothetical protein